MPKQDKEKVNIKYEDSEFINSKYTVYKNGQYVGEFGIEDLTAYINEFMATGCKVNLEDNSKQ